MKITDEMIAEWHKVYTEAANSYSNYTCPICREFVWWGESHTHKVEEENAKTEAASRRRTKRAAKR